jgi:TRAP-type mannitol/chloroaromatic compound transport system substrate-binding protein
MDRRAFLISTASGSAAVVAGLPARAAEPAPPRLRPDARLLTVAVDGPDHLPGHSGSLDRLALRLAEASDGRLGAVAQPATAGAADASLLAGDAHLAAHPAFAVFAGLPGAAALPADHFMAWLAIGGGQMLWDDLAAAHGFKPLLVGHSGPRPALWLARAEAPRAWSGLRVATSGLAGRVLAALGAVPVAMPVAEVTAALADGRIDAAEVGGALSALVLGCAGAARGVVEDGLHPAGRTTVLAVGRDVWEGLSPADRALVELVAREEAQLGLAEQAAHAGLAMSVARESGVAAVTLGAGLRAALDGTVATAVADIAAYDPAAARIAASYDAFRVAMDPAARAAV